jgi:hypothetical protein
MQVSVARQVRKDEQAVKLEGGDAGSEAPPGESGDGVFRGDDVLVARPSAENLTGVFDGK